MNPAVQTAEQSAMSFARREKPRFSRFAMQLGIRRQKRRAKVDRGSRLRAALVLRCGMHATELQSVTARMDRNDIGSVAIIAGSGKRYAQIPSEPLCGLIVTGSNTLETSAERAEIQRIVRTAMDRGVPVLALSEAVPLALSAAGIECGALAPAIVLIRESVELLEAEIGIDRAIDLMAAA